jgi:four helix bundle protein
MFFEDTDMIHGYLRRESMKVEDLDVFKLAHDLALKIYKTTATYPEGERFGLISQMRRAAAAICMNLMEGAHRICKNEYKYFISIARWSCGEVKYQLILSKDLGYINGTSLKR